MSLSMTQFRASISGDLTKTFRATVTSGDFTVNRLLSYAHLPSETRDELIGIRYLWRNQGSPRWGGTPPYKKGKLMFI